MVTGVARALSAEAVEVRRGRSGALRLLHFDAACVHPHAFIRSFRMSKTDLAARPMFVRTRDAIEAHLTIVFTALAVARVAQDRTGLVIRNVIRQLRPLRSAAIAVNGAVQVFPPAIEPQQQKIIDDLKNGRDLRH
jgi:hypothetical protein